ncbi:MAG: recombinase family protein [Magnetococcales bacterium]|nr:recombinase family protein [Magnetococcales bacterium]
MATIGYARVSSTDQNLEGQLEALSHCDEIFSEKESGARNDRPELTRLLDYIRKGDTVECVRMDRLARDTRHLLNLVDDFEARGVTLKVQNISLDTGTATGRLMLTMLGAVGEFEKNLLKERQKDGIARAKEKGVYTGRKPTARAKAEEVMQLVGEGVKKAEIARRLDIGVASVYRIIKAANV